MFANSISIFFRKYWLFIVVIFLLLIYLIFKIFFVKEKEDNIFSSTMKKISNLKKNKLIEYEIVKTEIRNNKIELGEIKKIKDEKERLKKLAEFANRH